MPHSCDHKQRCREENRSESQFVIQGNQSQNNINNKKQSSKSKLWIWLRGKGISLPNLITFSPQSTQDKKWGLTPTSDSRNSPWHKFVYIHTGTHIINSLIKLINKLKTKQLWSGIFKKQLTFSKYKVREKLKQGEYFYWVNNSSIKGNSFIMKFFQIYHYDSAFQMVKYYLFNSSVHIDTQEMIFDCVHL